MAAFVAETFPLTALLVFLIFRFNLNNRRVVGWLALSLVWGTIGSGVTYLVMEKGISPLNLGFELTEYIIYPFAIQIPVFLWVFLVVYLRKIESLAEGAVHGVATGLGFVIANVSLFRLYTLPLPQAFIFGLFYYTPLVMASAGIVGVAMTHSYERPLAKRIATMFSGMGAAIGLTMFFMMIARLEDETALLVHMAVAGVGSIIVVGNYVIWQIDLSSEKKRLDSLLEIVIPIGVQLSREKNFDRLLENILVGAKSFCKADAGTLYLVKEKQLEFSIVRNDALHIAQGGTTNEKITLPLLDLYDEESQPNHRNIATRAALTGQTVNIANAYKTEEYDFSGTRNFDRATGYRSISFLTIPLKIGDGNVLGVLQLINALNSKRKIIAFDKNLQQMMESFSSLATAALEGYIQEQSLRNEIKQLRIEIDVVKRKKQVDEITDTAYFRDLQEKARAFRHPSPGSEETPKD